MPMIINTINIELYREIIELLVHDLLTSGLMFLILNVEFCAQRLSVGEACCIDNITCGYCLL